jgi:uncharacterized protein (DUF433 family)
MWRERRRQISSQHQKLAVRGNPKRPATLWSVAYRMGPSYRGPLGPECEPAEAPFGMKKLLWQGAVVCEEGGCLKSQQTKFRRNANIHLSSRLKITVFHKKPIRQPKQSLAELPTYTIPEAAVFLGMSERRLQDWYSGESPILKASGHIGNVLLLSFRDLEEAYKVYLLRSKHSKSLQYLRKAMSDARAKTGSEHPLLTHDIDVMKRLALIIPGRGRRKRRAITLGDPSVPDYIPEVVKSWGIRISKTRDEIFPWRYASNDDTSTPVSLNPEVMSGRLVLSGTRIPVNMLWGRMKSGEKIEDIADDYRIDAKQVRQALAHVDKALPKVA